MKRKKQIHYDYSVGLNTPYWIQEIRSPKGKQLWYFNTPVELSFFFVFGVILTLMVIFLSDMMQALRVFSMGATNVLWFFLPYHVARLYTSYEPDGKKMHHYLGGALRYFRQFVLNKKPIYNGIRVSPMMETVVFKKTDL